MTTSTLKPRLLVLGLFGAAAAGGLVALRLLETPAAAAPTAGTPAPTEPAADATPVLVELFTSEGCSSCPPADAVLASLEQTQPVPGARVVPLGLHVDYWDRLGWADPFASARASERQRGYATLGSGSYTPQAVVDGHAEMVGSRRGLVEGAVAAAAQRPHAKLAVALAPRDAGAPYALTVTVGALPAPAAKDAELVIALTQTRARVDVKRGENAGQALDHTAIARELVVVGTVPPAGTTLQTTLKPAAGLADRDARFVAFVQERGSRRIVGTAVRDAAAR